MIFAEAAKKIFTHYLNNSVSEERIIKNQTKNGLSDLQKDYYIGTCSDASELFSVNYKSLIFIFRIGYDYYQFSRFDPYTMKRILASSENLKRFIIFKVCQILHKHNRPS